MNVITPIVYKATFFKIHRLHTSHSFHPINPRKRYHKTCMIGIVSKAVGMVVDCGIIPTLLGWLYFEILFLHNIILPIYAARLNAWESLYPIVTSSISWTDSFCNITCFFACNLNVWKSLSFQYSSFTYCGAYM